jgi:hypothetical protein
MFLTSCNSVSLLSLLPLLLLLLLLCSLALVGDVPEFREGRSRLAALEDRLQRRVEGRLADALQVSNLHSNAAAAAVVVELRTLFCSKSCGEPSSCTAAGVPMRRRMWKLWQVLYWRYRTSLTPPCKLSQQC